MIQHYIEFLFPGSFVDEVSVRPWPGDRPAPKSFPAACFGYRFFSQNEVVCDGETLRGKPQDFSPYTYIGKEMSEDDIKALPGGEARYSTLLSNMRINKWPRVVRTITGNFKPLLEGDKVLHWEGA